MPEPNRSFSTPVVTRRQNNTNNRTGILENVSYSQISGSSFSSSGSFRYDLPGSGLKSTQELNVDWSEFKNHVFFNSAQIKTNAAIQKIFDGFPFDGSKQEYELFFDGMTGYEKWIYDQFPKNVGYMFFSGTNGTELTEGTYITVKDQAGLLNSGSSTNISGRQFLNPGISSDLMIEFQLFIPPVSNSNQIILQKLNNIQNCGYQICLHETGSINETSISFTVVSSSQTLTTESNKLIVNKNQFNHLCFFWQRASNSLFCYNNHQLLSTSSMPVLISSLDFNSYDLLIGSGTTNRNTGFTPKNTLSGAMDELRIWHKFVSSDLRQKNEKRNVYAQPNLNLYFKFNEPSGSNSKLILDYSGNSLHGELSQHGFGLGVGNVATGSIAGSSPLVAEKPELNPNLFSVTTEFATLTSSLLTTAKTYDNNNPSWILNLVPSHFFLDGDYEEALATTDGELLEGINFFGFNKATMKQSQVLLLVLYLWAKFFDELKLMIDSFAYLNYVDFTEEDTIPDKFLQFFAKRQGFDLPTLFNNSSLTQFIDGEDLLNSDFGFGTSLKTIQYKIWRRILSNIQDIKKSKGTIHSIKSFIRSVGIEPDNNFRIRERGGPLKTNLSFSKQNKSEVMKQINFISGGLLTSPYLSSSRTSTELGFPGIANIPSDGLLTSGSWSFELMFQVPRNGANTYSNQSLARWFTTGSLGKCLIADIQIVSSSGLTVLFNPLVDTTPVSMSVSFNPMDNNIWNLCFSKQRADQLGFQSSSYQLRVARNSFGKIETCYSSSLFINDSNNNVFSFLSSSTNASGSWFEIGSSSITNINTGSFLSGLSFTDRVFNGKLSQIRFWSKHLTDVEWFEHVTNPKSIGTLNPIVNYGFNTKITGSFERLRIHAHVDQPVTSSNSSGQILLTDFSQNNFTLSGTSFPISSDVVQPKLFYYSYVNPYYDDLSTTNKVRIRSFISGSSFENNQEQYYAQQGKVYELNPNELVQDNAVLSIDYSAVDALNQDIANMFGTLELINNSIGAPELLFSPDYPDLEFLQKIYFNNLVDPINLKNCFDFYKWFDTSFGDFIKQLIPRKTKYFGINFVLESHMLERPKFEYGFGDSYVGESNRDPGSTLTLQFFRGKINRS